MCFRLIISSLSEKPLDQKTKDKRVTRWIKRLLCHNFSGHPVTFTSCEKLMSFSYQEKHEIKIRLPFFFQQTISQKNEVQLYSPLFRCRLKKRYNITYLHVAN
jgi:hypothetical protein